MKLQQFFLGILIAGLFGCQSNQKEVIIKGKFIGDIPDKILYSIPVNGICYEFFSSSAEVDSLGNFEFAVYTENTCFIGLFYGRNRGQLIIKPGENYNISIKSTDRENKIRYGCNNPKAQEMYQSFYSPLHPQMLIMEFLNSPISVAKNKIDSMYLKEASALDKLSSNGTISGELFDLIKLDRDVFYSSALQQLAAIKFSIIKRQNFEANTDSINKFWKEVILPIPLKSDKLLKSKWAYYFLQNYLLYMEHTNEVYNPDSFNEAAKKGLNHTYKIDIAKKYLSGSNLEFYRAAYILSMAFQKKYEKELITLFDEFKSDFPESKYTKYIEPYIVAIINFHNKAEQKFNEESKFLNDYKNINSLAECLKPFKGTKVYVDIWSTSCGPCKDEFKHARKLEQMLKTQNVKQLYISLDSDTYEKRWKDMINYYELKGYHVRASAELKAEISALPKFIGIPRYLLVDENGNIVVNDAKRPSQLKELEKQINEIGL